MLKMVLCFGFGRIDLDGNSKNIRFVVQPHPIVFPHVVNMIEQ